LRQYVAHRQCEIQYAGIPVLNRCVGVVSLDPGTGQARNIGATSTYEWLCWPRRASALIIAQMSGAHYPPSHFHVSLRAADVFRLALALSSNTSAGAEQFNKQLVRCATADFPAQSLGSSLP
jgi:hypothetical protein